MKGVDGCSIVVDVMSSSRLFEVLEAATLNAQDVMAVFVLSLTRRVLLQIQS